MKTICMLDINIELFINLESSSEAPEELWELLSSVQAPNRVIFVGDESLKTDQVEYHLKNYNIQDTIKINYVWNDLSEELRHKILQTELKFQNHDIKLCDIVNQSSGSVQYISLAKLIKGTFKSIGKPMQINDGYNLEYFIDPSLKHPEFSNGSISFDVFLKKVEGRRLVLISDEAGMGKSTTLTHASFKLKAQHPDHWILRVDLHKHVESLKFDVCDVITLLCEHFEVTDGKFEKSLMNDLLNDGKIILMLDGLDEISPYYDKQFLVLMSELTKSPIKQIWLTMRPHLADDIERKFKEKFWELQKFSSEDQVDFMAKYWRTKLSTKSTDKLQTFAEHLIEQISKSIEGESLSLVGIPLQTRMIADIFLDDVQQNLKHETNVFELPEHFDILWLFEEFMIKKIKITSSERGEIVGTEKARNEVEDVDILGNHESLAIRLLFLKDEEDFNSPTIILDEDFFELDVDDDQLQRYGIITVEPDSKTFFIHRTYAEYFVARFIARVFKKKSNLYFIPEAVKLLCRVTVVRNGTILTFLDLLMKQFILKSAIDKKILKKVAFFIKKKFKDIKFKFVSLSITLKKVFLSKFLFECLYKLPDDILTIDIIRHFLELAAMSGNKSLILGVLELPGVSYENYSLQVTCISCLSACFCRFPCNVIEMEEECLTFEQIKNETFSEKISLEFFQKRSIMDEFQKIIKIGPFGKALLRNHFIDYHKCYLQSLPIKPEAGLSKYVLKYFRLFLDHRWSVIQKIYDTECDNEIIAISNFFVFFLEGLILATDYKNEDHDQIVLIFKWLTEKFKSSETLKLFTDTFLTLAISRVKWKASADEIISVLKDQIGDEGFLKCLKDSPNFSYAIYSNKENFINLLKHCSKLFTKNELKVFISSSKASMKENLITSLMLHDSPVFLEFTLEIVRNNFSNEEILEILCDTKYKDELLIDFAIKFSDSRLIQILLDWLHDNVNEEDQRKLKLQKISNSLMNMPE